MQTYDIYGAITIFGMGIIGGFLFGCSCEVISFAIGGIIKIFKKHEKEGITMEGIQTALTEAFTTVSTNCNTAIANVLPIALGVVGAVMVVTFGIKVFKKLTGKA